jgi:hypothetical protein
MKSLKAYGNHYLAELLGLRIPFTEAAILVAFVLMCLVTLLESNVGVELQGQQALDVARQKAHQELMALRTTVAPN